jgi:hypothetical protein
MIISSGLVRAGLVMKLMKLTEQMDSEFRIVDPARSLPEAAARHAANGL